jgi:hypothetical protein
MRELPKIFVYSFVIFPIINWMTISEVMDKKTGTKFAPVLLKHHPVYCPLGGFWSF